MKSTIIIMIIVIIKYFYGIQIIILKR